MIYYMKVYFWYYFAYFTFIFGKNGRKCVLLYKNQAEKL